MNIKLNKLLLSALLYLSTACGFITLNAQNRTHLHDIYIRDPYILADTKTQTYYMYRSSTSKKEGKELGGVEAFRSKDLEHWEGPFRVFTVDPDNFITGGVWAPEVHAYNGQYYLFATLNSNIEWKGAIQDWPKFTFRNTQIFHADSPDGPFIAFDTKPHTPIDRMALDGTLWVENGKPYMIYCHEWVQVADGTMELVELAPDLSKAVSESTTLFCASAADWSTGSVHKESLPKSYVTDGCFLYKTKTGKLLMIWSSFMNGEYAIGIAESTTNKVTGPWKQQQEPIFTKHGGHGMIFTTFDGKLCLTFHQPNSPGGAERAHIYELEDTGDSLRLRQELFPYSTTKN